MVYQSRNQDSSGVLAASIVAGGALLAGAYFLWPRMPRENISGTPDKLRDLDRQAPPPALENASLAALPPEIEESSPYTSSIGRALVEPPDLGKKAFQTQADGSECLDLPWEFSGKYTKFKADWIGHVNAGRIEMAAFLIGEENIEGYFKPFISCSKQFNLLDQLRIAFLTELAAETTPELQRVLLSVIHQAFYNDPKLWTEPQNLFSTLERNSSIHDCNVLGALIDLIPDPQELPSAVEIMLSAKLTNALNNFDLEEHTVRCVPDNRRQLELSERLIKHPFDLNRQFLKMLSSNNPELQTIALKALIPFYYKRMGEVSKEKAIEEVREMILSLPSEAQLSNTVNEARAELERHLTGQVYRGPYGD